LAEVAAKVEGTYPIMKKLAIGLLAAGVALIGQLSAQIIPAEDFSHQPAFKGHILSPDGKILAYNETVKGENRIFLLDLDTNKKFGLELLGRDEVLVQGSSFFGPTAVVLSTAPAGPTPRLTVTDAMPKQTSKAALCCTFSATRNTVTCS